MIDIKLLRNEWNKTIENIKLRCKNYQALDNFSVVDEKWRKVSTELQALNTQKNELSKQISAYVAQNNTGQVAQLKEQVLKNKQLTENLEKESVELENQLKMIMFSIPNILDSEHNVLGESTIGVPFGEDENKNIEVRRMYEPRKLDFTPLPHWEIGVKLGLLDFNRGRKIGGERMYFFTGDGARLLRALRNFTLDLHINEAGYSEVLPPILLNAEPLYGLGKLPLFEEDMYQTTDRQFLAGTEEHPITAMYMNETLDASALPIKLTSSATSFRKEAGSAGKDTRGILRVHQFYNTELINFALPSQSWDLLEEMCLQAEKVLKILEIPYRIIKLCSGDTGDAAATTYDFEVWVPSNNTYREISSCSNVLDYQARGLSIKYLDPATKKTNYVHTLNGTGVSLNRLWIAIVENFQTADGKIEIPRALRGYMNNQEFIEAK